MGETVTAAPARAGIETLSDEEVVRRVGAGEPALFEVVMRRYNPRLFRLARAIVRNDDEAEDVLQQAYVNAFSNLHQFAGDARFATWLIRIATNEALARLRRRGRWLAIEPTADGEPGVEAIRAVDPSPEQQAFAGELRRALEASLDALPPLYVSVFVLREVEGLSTSDVAECLQVSEDVVKTRLRRARALLRHELDRAGLSAATVFPFHAPRCNRVVGSVFARLGVPTVH